MGLSTEPIIRPASPSDGRALAKLIDIAGEGIPSWLWTSMARPGQSALDVGEERAKRESGGFSYRHAQVAETSPDVAGMMLGYVIDEPSADDRAAVRDLPEPIRPFIELEHQAIGTFYVNALAVFPGRRGAGIGTMLLHAAEEQAEGQCASTMSIMVYAQNTGAVGLYRRLGYRAVAARPVLLHPCQPYYDGDVLLLTKEL